MTTNKSITSVSSGQEKQIIRFGSDAVESALKDFGLDKDGAQRVIEHGDEFNAAIKEATRIALQNLSVSNQYANEEVDSNYNYPDEYQYTQISDQVARLRQLFPELSNATYDESVANGELPPHAEGWFAIPRWEKIAGTYGEAVQKVLDLISKERKFYNYRDCQLDPKHLRQHTRTVIMLQKLADEQQGHDILIIPAQFGLRHRGRSVRRAREVFNAPEFGLGSFAVGCMILTHPQRLVRWEQLHMDCTGDEFAPDADGQFRSAPLFRFRDGEVGFGTHWVSDASDDYGSVSAFVPQC